MLLLLAWSALALATPSLTDVRVFPGDGHLRLALVFDGPPGPVASHAEAHSAGAAAAVVVQDETRRFAPLATEALAASGLTAVEAVDVPDDALELWVRLGRSRSIRAAPLTDPAVLVDRVEEGRGDDPALPSVDQLRAWLEGTTLRSAAPREPAGRHLLVLDAGHGGWDHGAEGTTGRWEADLALHRVLRSQRVLGNRYGYRVVLTRRGDVFPGLTERAALGNDQEADLFVSIHANAAPAPTAWGIATYSLDAASDAGAARVTRQERAAISSQIDGEGRGDPLLARLLVAGTNALSRRLSTRVQETAIDRLQDSFGAKPVRDLGSKTASFTVQMPTMRFEAGFVSNPDDEHRLRTPHRQQEVAGAIGDAIEGRFATADARGREASP